MTIAQISMFTKLTFISWKKIVDVVLNCLQ